MSSRVYLNGEFVDKLDAKLSVYDHGLLYGDGVWEGMRLFRGEIFRLSEHIELLVAAAEDVSLALPFSKDDLAIAVHQAVAANSRQFGYIRIIITRGPGTIGLDPRKCDPHIVILVDDIVPFPAELYEHGVHLITSTKIRLDPANPLHRVRSLSHGHMAIAKAEALKAGCLEAVLLDTKGRIATCTEGAFFAVQNGEIRTVPSSEAMPRDVMANIVRELAETANIPVRETPLAADQVTKDELFLAGTNGGIIGIVRLDGQSIGRGEEGPITRTLRLAFRELTHQRR